MVTLRMYMAGMTDRAIARQLDVSVVTVRRRLTRIRLLVGARTRVEAVALLVHSGLLDPTRGSPDHK